MNVRSKIRPSSLFMIVLVLAATHLGAQEQKSKTMLDMGLKWKKGDLFSYQRVKENSDVRQGKITSQTKTETNILIEVLDKDKNSSTVAWTMRKKQIIQSGNPGIHKIAVKLNEVVPTIKIIFKTDAKGNPTSLVNQDEIIAIYTKASTQMSAWMTETKVNPKLAQAILQQLAPYRDPRSVAFFCLRDPIMFLIRFESVELGVPMLKDTTFPNPQDPKGENSLPAKLRLHFAKSENGLSYVEFLQVLDQQKAKTIMLQNMQQQAIQAGQPLPTAESVPRVDIRLETRLRMNQKTGMPLDLSNSTTRAMNGGGRVERVFYAQNLAGQKRAAMSPLPTSKPASRPTQGSK